MSCHAAMGTWYGSVPGVKNYTDYSKIKNDSLDFVGQLAFAKRNKISIEDIHNLISNLEIKRLEQGNEIDSHTI